MNKISEGNWKWLEANGFGIGDWVGNYRSWTRNLDGDLIVFYRHYDAGWKVEYRSKANWGQQPHEALIALYKEEVGRGSANAVLLKPLVLPAEDLQVLVDAGFRSTHPVDLIWEQQVQGLWLHVSRKLREPVWEAAFEFRGNRHLRKDPVEDTDIRQLLETATARLPEVTRELTGLLQGELRTFETTVAEIRADIAALEVLVTS